MIKLTLAFLFLAATGEAIAQPAPEIFNMTTAFIVQKCVGTATGTTCEQVPSPDAGQTVAIEIDNCIPLDNGGSFCEGQWSTNEVTIEGETFSGLIQAERTDDGNGNVTYSVEQLIATESVDGSQDYTQSVVELAGSSIADCGKLIGPELTSPSDPHTFYFSTLAIGPAGAAARCVRPVPAIGRS